MDVLIFYIQYYCITFYLKEDLVQGCHEMMSPNYYTELSNEDIYHSGGQCMVGMYEAVLVLARMADTSL